MKWLHKAGEHSKAIAAIIVLGSMITSGFAWAAGSYIDGRVVSVVSEAMGDFRTEWRCSEWNEELEERLTELRDMPEDMPPARRAELENRVRKLQALIVDNQCSRFDA